MMERERHRQCIVDGWLGVILTSQLSALHTMHARTPSYRLMNVCVCVWVCVCVSTLSIFNIQQGNTTTLLRKALKEWKCMDLRFLYIIIRKRCVCLLYNYKMVMQAKLVETGRLAFL